MLKKILLSIIFTCFNISKANTIFEDKTSFIIALQQQNLDYLEELSINISNPQSKLYGHYIKDYRKIQDIISLPSIKLEPVYDWLKNYSINITGNYGDALKCEGYISNINNLLNVKLVKLSDINGKSLYRSFQDYTIPKHLNNYIVFIEGVSNKIHKRFKIKFKNQDNVDNNYCGNEVIHRLYNISNLTNVSNDISICSIEYQGNSGFSLDDLESAQSMNNVKKTNVTHIIGNDEYPDDESQLDMQMMAINVPNADIWFWDGDDWLYSLAVNMSNTENIPDILSMSWGWSESDQCSITHCDNVTSQQYVNRVNTEYMKLVLRGVTITVSSGDSGAPGRTNLDCYDNSDTVHATFPGSSHWVTSVGATYVKNSNISRNWTTPLCKQYGCCTGNDEFVTNNNDTGWTAGGGINNYTERTKYAYWQDSFVTNYLNSGVPLPLNFNRNGRAYPDVSVVGHYCPVMSAGSPEPVDGTSCSSPIFASLVALLNNHQVENGKPKLGFINPVLYRMAMDNPEIFKDIDEGNNWSTEQTTCPERADGGSDFGYKATKGFDPVYGLGAPNIGLMKEWLDSNL